MPGDLVLWFDARSADARRALELLRERGLEPELRRYLEEPPTEGEVETLLGALGVAPHAVARESEDEYQALRLSPRTPRAELVRALSRHPRILDGPFLVGGGRAVVARPPERALELVPPPASPEAPFGAPVAIPVDGTLDLHAFRPGEVGDLVPEWIEACAAAGLVDLRIVHGKGTGALRRTVEALLARHPRVASFRTAGEDGGGWGATLVRLRG